ncbi:hypothetical protein ES319_A13G046800v1 [Gossypium barbadense]|uniref:Uncharacterized protein n=2 Tax=Gossypium TaxID=3633 RepID=A0A5J5T0T2_GOSBA|nr:hypothetical protein ES319_A13G046800v1 [Gossypium barbadense]KAB2047460.1 hypothetical protein ES319_A13G046800v1 [Gossypium barbadense]
MECYLDCGTPASIVFLMGVHILPFVEKAVGRKAHINLYLLRKVILLILLHMVIQASAAKGFLSSCI